MAQVAHCTESVLRCDPVCRVEMAAKGPLSGFKVLDLTMVLSGPMASMILADQGADVIKLEAKGNPDTCRSMGRQPTPTQAVCPGGGLSAAFMHVNRNKRSLVLDLKRDEGREAFLDLAKTMDVVIQNYRPGAVDGLGIGYEAVRKVNPQVIYVSISGFGSSGPYSEKRVYDPLIQAISGMTHLQSSATGEPQLVNQVICDKVTSLTAAQAISAALLARSLTGEGQHVELSMMDAALQFVWPEGFYNNCWQYPDNHDAAGPPMPSMSKFYKLYRCQDGYVTALSVSDAEFCALCDALELHELKEDPNMKTLPQRLPFFERIVEVVSEKLRHLTVEETLSKLDAFDVPCAPVNSEPWKDQQVLHSSSLVVSKDVRFPGASLRMPRPAVRFGGTRTSDCPRRQAPLMGQDSVEVLSEVMPSEKVSRLVAAGIAVGDASLLSRL